MTDDTGGGARRRGPRSDAAANRAAILAAAEARFARDGIDASLRTIAEDAGVGIATLYRNFEDRYALIRALFSLAGQRLDVEVGADLRADAPAWDRLVRGIETACRIVIAHPALYLARDWLMRHDPGFTEVPSWVDVLLTTVAEAHADGSLRADVEAGDIVMIPTLLTPLAAFPSPAREVVAARQLGLLIRSLSTDPDAFPLPGRALDQEAVSAVSQRARRHD